MVVEHLSAGQVVQNFACTAAQIAYSLACHLAEYILKLTVADTITLLHLVDVDSPQNTATLYA